MTTIILSILGLGLLCFLALIYFVWYVEHKGKSRSGKI